MHLVGVETSASPDDPQKIRITGTALSASGQRLELWAEVEEQIADGLSDSGNPWLIALLPIAASLGEDIQIDLPVDALLVENVKGVNRVWAKWYPDLSVIDVAAPAAAAMARPNGKTAAFFSGGIDSYFTIARRIPGNSFQLPVVGALDDLITVQGFDLAVHDHANFAHVSDGVRKIAQEIGINHMVVRTNLRANQTAWMRRWGPLTHAAGIAFVSHLLENRYDSVVFGSAYPLASVIPWGSHPMVDPYFSSSRMRLIHDGAASTRVEKTQLVALFPPAMKYLHVCQATGVDNCSRCEKCYRTMITFDLLGMKTAADKLFDWTGYSTKSIERVYLKANDIMFDEIVTATRSAARRDLYDALQKAQKRSRSRRPVVNMAKTLERIPSAWRLSSLLRRLALRNFITDKYVSHERI